MNEKNLNIEEKIVLIKYARLAIKQATLHEALPQPDQADLSPRLEQTGASFVTLTKSGGLRGCIGAIEAYQPLIRDVIEHAAAAAVEDYRFAPVQPAEVDLLDIEISILTPPKKLEYKKPDELISNLRPGIDGVILRDGLSRATFLPQVWEKLPDMEEFLMHLCMKMGAAPDLWKRKVLDVWVYQVEEFSEKEIS